MRLLSTLGLVSLVMCASVSGESLVAAQRGCCVSVSKVRVVNFIMRRGGAGVQCRQQDILEGCNINAVILKWRRRQVCVDPTPLKMRKLLSKLCSSRAAGKGVRRPRGRKTNT